MAKYKQYIVVAGYYDNKTNAGEFIQALGCFDNAEQAYGTALLWIDEQADSKKGEMITPLYELEGSTGFGMDVKHETYTDYVYVLFCEEIKEEE